MNDERRHISMILDSHWWNMSNAIEEAVQNHIQNKSRVSLCGLYQAMLSGTLLVPLFADLAKDATGRTDVPVRCIRLPNGEGCLPVFTSADRLREWKAEGSKYAEMPGSTLFEMVSGMPEVDCVYLNYSERKGTPKGKLGRHEFESLARGILPGDA
jgi:hypothetical protein